MQPYIFAKWQKVGLPIRIEAFAGREGPFPVTTGLTADPAERRAECAQ